MKDWKDINRRCDAARDAFIRAANSLIDTRDDANIAEAMIHGAIGLQYVAGASSDRSQGMVTEALARARIEARGDSPIADADRGGR